MLVVRVARWMKSHNLHKKWIYSNLNENIFLDLKE
jgi:hypothetical protein